MLREILVVNHRQKSSELDLATKRVEFGSCVLSHLRESYAESRADCPCWTSPFEMDEMVKTAVNAYNGKKLTDDGAWLEDAPPSSSRGVMERVLESCRKQSEVARLLVHRETLYAGADTIQRPYMYSIITVSNIFSNPGLALPLYSRACVSSLFVCYPFVPIYSIPRNGKLSIIAKENSGNKGLTCTFI